MKTALDWFIEKLEEEELIFNHGLVERWKQQAKDMEREEIEAAYEEGFHAGGVIAQLSNLPERYYEDIFKT